VERERGVEVGREVGPVVTAGIEMEFVGDFAGGENLVESEGAGVEAEIVFGAAVEIDFKAGERSGAGESERTVAFPEGGIGRETEDAAENAGATGGGAAAIAGKECGKFFNEGSAVGADGRK
jgi:hypothetical protein